MDEEAVVPILGADLLALNVEGTETFLYPLLARKLAARLSVEAGDLPAGSELEDVSRRFLAKSNDVQEIYRSLRVVFRELEPLPIPEALLDLARIARFKLFVATTFDVLAERAVDSERFDGQRQTLAFAYAPSDRQDLPPEFGRLGRPAVFHLMGRLSGTPHTFAVTREDTLEFMESLQSRPPGFLFDKLRDADLLFLGSPLSAWLGRLLGQGSPERDAPVLFVDRGRGTMEAPSVETAIGFVRELHRRWTEFSPDEEAAPPPLAASLTAPAGAVLVSCVTADESAGESIREALDRAGVDVILDHDDSPLAAKWEKRLKSALALSSAFVPLVSRRSLGTNRRFLQGEWVEAILEAGRAAPSGRFVVPVAIDDTARESPAIPREFGDLKWERLPGGKPSSELVKTLIQLQRSYRRAKSA
jgi:hypothetical protein